MSHTFSYQQAFARNIGWVTQAEQSVLRGKRIAIAGMGGFHIADFDSFDIANFNRQVGATMSTLGLPKVEVLAGMARDINPEAQIVRFPGGVNSGNLAQFFEGVDLYVDG